MNEDEQPTAAEKKLGTFLRTFISSSQPLLLPRPPPIARIMAMYQVFTHYSRQAHHAQVILLTNCLSSDSLRLCWPELWLCIPGKLMPRSPYVPELDLNSAFKAQGAQFANYNRENPSTMNSPLNLPSPLPRPHQLPNPQPLQLPNLQTSRQL